LNGALVLAIFYRIQQLGANYIKVVEDIPIMYATKMSKESVAFSKFIRLGDRDIRRGYQERVQVGYPLVIGDNLTATER